MDYYISGIDGSGKTTVSKILKSLGYKSVDRYKALDHLTFSIEYDPTFIPKSNVVVLTADLDILINRINNRDKPIDIFETKKSLYYFDRRFREFAKYYGFLIIDTTNITPEQVTNIILKNEKFEPFKDLKSSDLLNNKYKLITEGESKQVFQIKDDPDNCYIILKNTVYSHSMQSTEIIDNLGTIRGKGSRYFLEMMNRNMIPHSYICINNNGIIYSRFMKNINQLEIVVKKYCEGTDKHSFYKYKDEYTDNGRYINGPYVRFDWRNPNHLNSQGEDVRTALPNYYEEEIRLGKHLNCPMGDKTISEKLVNSIIDVVKVEELALKMFHTIQHYFNQVGLIIKDICFMISETDSSLMFWSEINQDCMRIGTTDGEKDIWRTGGSSKADQLVTKWTKFNSIMESYFVKSDYESCINNKLFDYQISMKEEFEFVGNNITHKSIYYKCLRTGNRRFLVYYVRIPDKCIFPDILVKFHPDDLEKYKSFYPHVIVNNLEEAKLAIANSARRIYCVNYLNIPYDRKIKHMYSFSKYLKLDQNIISRNTVYVLNSKIIGDNSIVIWGDKIALKKWTDCFKHFNITVVIQDITGNIKKVSNYDINELDQLVNSLDIVKILTNHETYDSVILIVENYETKAFWNIF